MRTNKLKMRETMIAYAFLAPILLFFLIFVFAPMVMGFVTSFFNYSMTQFTFIGLANYNRMFHDSIFMKSLINTVIIVIGSVPVVVFFSLFVAAMALPKQVVLVPLVRIINFMGIHDTLWAVILPLVGWPFGVFLMKQFSENIPTELLESAKIDGCGEIRTFINVAFPIVKPGFAALAIFTFINTWNDYFMQLVMLTSRNNLTISLGVATMQAEMATNYGLIMAGAALATVPIVTVFLVFQKSFTQGITMGAVKG